MTRFAALALAMCLLVSFPAAAADSTDLSIVLYGEYPVVEELREGRFESDAPAAADPLFEYGAADDVEQRAMAEALHLMSASVYGYTFTFKPGSELLETGEVFDIELRGRMTPGQVKVLASGVRDKVYRVKIEFELTPSVHRWMSAFASNTLRQVESEGTSDFYQGWGGRSDALREALRNLVLTAAKKQLRSKPLVISGDILVTGNPVFSVGAGRHYCRISGYVNLIDVVTYD